MSISAALAWAAGCSEDGGGDGAGADDGRGGKEVELDPNQATEPGGASASGGAAGRPPLEEPGSEPAPVPSMPARGVADFEREAQQTTARAEGARGFGGACQSTADCRAGLGCASVVFSGSNQPYIAGGYCSRWCEQDSDCAALDAEAFCEPGFFGSDLNLCLLPCVTGDNDGAEKCGGREDLSCSIGRVPGVEAACIPRCRSNMDCASGYCSSLTGLCQVGLAGSTDPAGSACPSGVRSCNGFCEASSPSATSGVCSGYCRLGSTCGEGPGSVCASEHFGLREGDGGTCQQACDTSADCAPGVAACSPTGMLDAEGEPVKGCAHVYAAPMNLAPQRLSVEQLAIASLPSGVINVTTSSIFEALSHRLTVDDGAVCVAGDVIGEFGALLELYLQMRPNNGAPFPAALLSGFSFEAEGDIVVRFDVYTPGRSFRYLSGLDTAGDIAEGPQRIGTDQLFDIWAGDAPFAELATPELEALAFSLILEDGAGPFRFCLKNLALELGGAPPAP